MIWTSENLSLRSDFSDIVLRRTLLLAKACFTNTDKNEYGSSLQRSSTRCPSNQTHERKVNMFEGDTSEVAIFLSCQVSIDYGRS